MYWSSRRAAEEEVLGPGAMASWKRILDNGGATSALSVPPQLHAPDALEVGGSGTVPPPLSSVQTQQGREHEEVEHYSIMLALLLKFTHRAAATSAV